MNNTKNNTVRALCFRETDERERFGTVIDLLVAFMFLFAFCILPFLGIVFIAKHGIKSVTGKCRKHLTNC